MRLIVHGSLGFVGLMWRLPVFSAIPLFNRAAPGNEAEPETRACHLPCVNFQSSRPTHRTRNISQDCRIIQQLVCTTLKENINTSINAALYSPGCWIFGRLCAFYLQQLISPLLPATTKKALKMLDAKIFSNIGLPMALYLDNYNLRPKERD